MEKMRNSFLRFQCFNKIFSTKSKKDTIYVRIIYISFLSRTLLCKNIYTMSSFKWSNELFSILKWWYLYCIFLSFLIYEVSYSKNIKNFRKNAEFIFAIGFQTVFWGTYFCETVFWGSNFCNFRPIHKNNFRNNLWSQKILPLRLVNKLFANLLKYKENTKVSVGIKFGKGLLTSCVLDSSISMTGCR